MLEASCCCRHAAAGGVGPSTGKRALLKNEWEYDNVEDQPFFSFLPFCVDEAKRIFEKTEITLGNRREEGLIARIMVWNRFNL